MSGRIKIKSKDKDKRPKIDVFKVIENRFKNMNELRDLIDMDPRKGLVRIRDGAGFREVERGGCLYRFKEPCWSILRISSCRNRTVLQTEN